jgi:hypothetical protein
MDISFSTQSSSQDNEPSSSQELIARTLHRDLSYKECIQICALYYLGDMCPKIIAGIYHRTVSRCLIDLNTSIKRSGCPSVLRTLLCLELINYATTNAIQQYKPREQIAKELGYDVYTRIIKAAFDKE